MNEILFEHMLVQRFSFTWISFRTYLVKNVINKINIVTKKKYRNPNNEL